MSNSLTQHFDKARAEYDHANALMKHHQDEIKRMEQELKWAQQLVIQREQAMLEAVVKDGVTATTATAAMVALNPAAAAKVGVAASGASKAISVAALGWKQHLIAGGLARGVAVSTLFPVDSIKTKMQVGQKVSLRLDTIGIEHFKGFNSALIGQIPYGMLVFGTYETLKSKIFARRPEMQESLSTKVPVYITCACAGDTIGAVWLTPSEIVKQRLQSGAATSASSAIKSIYAEHGARGFYAGFSGLLARDLPYRAMQLPLYEICRDAYSDKYCTPFDRGIFPHEAMMVGACVGMLSAGITTPLDVVKSRMMVGDSKGLSVSSVVANIYKEGGMAGLFTGVKQRVGYLGLSNGIFFIMYEFARGVLTDAPVIQIAGS
mmetsp:Transcript_32866/g.52924  ORF Transcript_32866/g.52924 Transcript_32866/m.52924 type:complete len:377 (+) Transcript_32866:119-1249(+)|eukprot:CAMPEP_0179430980 /NCGR_PEP_ID=MMETSP0799-20121207/15980_1 /TAXON_ID=46947 /ORGANISM="Geminigera cryophila, Strain CCMP2564" /LENGTH=376 /DNA_ID=CAMNT_0021207673 /DNA_START=109 /DNA_END=1239 /DNA_ORIENTATION=+